MFGQRVWTKQFKSFILQHNTSHTHHKVSCSVKYPLSLAPSGFSLLAFHILMAKTRDIVMGQACIYLAYRRSYIKYIIFVDGVTVHIDELLVAPRLTPPAEFGRRATVISSFVNEFHIKLKIGCACNWRSPYASAFDRTRRKIVVRLIFPSVSLHSVSVHSFNTLYFWFCRVMCRRSASTCLSACLFFGKGARTNLVCLLLMCVACN